MKRRLKASSGVMVSIGLKKEQLDVLLMVLDMVEQALQTGSLGYVGWTNKMAALNGLNLLRIILKRQRHLKKHLQAMLDELEDED